jgi:hypothetical protein
MFSPNPEPREKRQSLASGLATVAAAAVGAATLLVYRWGRGTQLGAPPDREGEPEVELR